MLSLVQGGNLQPCAWQGAYSTSCPGLVPDFLPITRTMSYLDICIQMGTRALGRLTALWPQCQLQSPLSGLLRLLSTSNQSSATCKELLILHAGVIAGWLRKKARSQVMQKQHRGFSRESVPANVNVLPFSI